jgi:hypothetical protein
MVRAAAGSVNVEARPAAEAATRTIAAILSRVPVRARRIASPCRVIISSSCFRASDVVVPEAQFSATCGTQIAIVARFVSVRQLERFSQEVSVAALRVGGHDQRPRKGA